MQQKKKEGRKRSASDSFALNLSRQKKTDDKKTRKHELTKTKDSADPLFFPSSAL